jgi:hypothetical protein
VQQNESKRQTSETHWVMPSHPLTSGPPDLQALCEQVPVLGPSHDEHEPLMHVLPPLQTVPQLPQLLLSDAVFTHAPLQHDWLPHAFPHDPQLLGSVLVSTQTLLHAVWLPLQPSVHLPATQLHVEFGGPPVHAVPHAPQFFASVWVSMQAPLQREPVVHAHLPAEHDAPDGQTFPHDPQFFGSVWTLPHPPPSGVGFEPVSRRASVPPASVPPPPPVSVPTLPVAQAARTIAPVPITVISQRACDTMGICLPTAKA